MSLADALTDEQFDRARALWAEGRSLGDVATALGVSLYALSPWLYTEDTPPNQRFRQALGYEGEET